MKIETAVATLRRLVNDSSLSDSQGIAVSLGADALTILAGHRASISILTADAKSARVSHRLRLRVMDRFRRGTVTPAEGTIPRRLYDAFPAQQARTLTRIMTKFLTSPGIEVPVSLVEEHRDDYRKASVAYTRYYILRGIRDGYLVMEPRK
jgi:hypothetical protein